MQRIFTAAIGFWLHCTRWPWCLVYFTMSVLNEAEQLFRPRLMSGCSDALKNHNVLAVKLMNNLLKCVPATLLSNNLKQ